MNTPEFITPVRAVFVGGEATSRTGQPLHIARITSYSTQVLPNFNSVENGRPPSDTEGNLVLIPASRSV